MPAVLFVCLGNICRSPTAEAVFSSLLATRASVDSLRVDSCGTGHWHVGRAPDARAIAAGAARDYRLDMLRARQLEAADFERFDWIVAMDQDNLDELHRQCPADFKGKLVRLLEYHPDTALTDVPDPYYGEDDGFGIVLDLVERACDGLLEAILARHAR